MGKAGSHTARSCLLAGLLLLAALLAGCGPTYQPPFTVGTNPWIGYEPLYLARALGQYDNVPLQLVELGSNTQAMDALRAGRLDAAGLTLDEALTLADEQVPIKIVWVLDVSAGADALVARSDIPTLAALRGRRIGVEQTAVGAYLLDAALRRADLSAVDVTLVPLPVDAHVSAFESGAIDAVVTFDPARQALLNAGGQVLFDSRMLPGEVVDVLVVRRDALDCCTRAIARLIDGQQRALDHLARHREDALAHMAPRLGLSSTDVARSLEGLVLPDAAYNRSLLDGPTPDLAETARHQARLMRQRGLLSTDIDTRGLIDSRFLQPESRP